MADGEATVTVYDGRAQVLRDEAGHLLGIIIDRSGDGTRSVLNWKGEPVGGTAVGDHIERAAQAAGTGTGS